MESRAETHDKLWIRNCELFKDAAIDILTFDQLPKKRIVRLLRLQEERLEEQQKYLENLRARQEREADRNRNKK